MKVFISQPMKGKSDEVVIAERKLIEENVKKLYGEDVIILDSIFTEFHNSDNNPIKCLAKSIEVLADADVAYFSTGWRSARGCRIENDIARVYGIKIAGDKS